jgi:hypothetical protein
MVAFEIIVILMNHLIRGKVYVSLFEIYTSEFWIESNVKSSNIALCVASFGIIWYIVII